MTPTNNFLKTIDLWEKNQLYSNASIREIVKQNINIIEKIKDSSLLIFQDDGRITPSKLENSISLEVANKNLEKFINFAKDHFSDLLAETKSNELLEKTRISDTFNRFTEKVGVNDFKREKIVKGNEEPTDEILDTPSLEDLKQDKSKLENKLKKITRRKKIVEKTILITGACALAIISLGLSLLTGGAFTIALIVAVALIAACVGSVFGREFYERQENRINKKILENELASLKAEEAEEAEEEEQYQDSIPVQELSLEDLEKLRIPEKVLPTQLGLDKFIDLWVTVNKTNILDIYDSTTGKFPIYETYYPFYEADKIDEFKEFIKKNIDESSRLNKEEIEAVHEKFMESLVKKFLPSDHNTSNT